TTRPSSARTPSTSWMRGGRSRRPTAWGSSAGCATSPAPARAPTSPAAKERRATSPSPSPPRSDEFDSASIPDSRFPIPGSNMNRADFLLEIRTEEIPALALRGAREDLQARVVEGLAAEGLVAESARSLATPRRLILLLFGLPERQEDRLSEVL